MLSWELAPYPSPLVATIGKTSICHKERRKGKKEDKDEGSSHCACVCLERIPTTAEKAWTCSPVLFYLHMNKLHHFGYILQNPPNLLHILHRLHCTIGGANRPKNQPPKSQGPWGNEQINTGSQIMARFSPKGRKKGKNFKKVYSLFSRRKEESKNTLFTL